jgi:drug/metabolite transporter (DMT)-like permease
VGAMAATGLAALAVFSHFVMKERVGIKEIAGICVIVIAAGLIGIFSKDNPPSLIHLDLLVAMLSAVVFLSCLLWVIFRKSGGLTGLIIGVFSGALGGFVPLFQKVSTSDLGTSLSLFPIVPGAGKEDRWGRLLLMLSNPFTVIWILLSLVSMIVLQFAYKKAEVIRIIPFFTSSCIIIPVIGGVLCLEEKLHPVQWVGVALILGGLLLLTLKGRSSEKKPPPEPERK